MGLFDRFKKRVNEVAEQTDADALSAAEDSPEAKAALAAAKEHASRPEPVPTTPLPAEPAPTAPSEDDWEDLDEAEPIVEAASEEWDEWDDEEEVELPRELSRRERKIVEKAKKADTKRERLHQKEMKKRGAVAVARPEGS